jgi:UDP-GlcNAc:undecaprenyl-phosphate GlcNAc-1-phosphate transferase
MPQSFSVLILCFVLLHAVVTWLARQLFLTYQLVDHPDDRKKHGLAVPYCGGIALYISLTALTMILQPNRLLLIMYLPLLFIFVVSLIDDARKISSYGRLLAQAVTIVLLIMLLQGANPTAWLSLIPTPILGLQIVGLFLLIFCGSGIINAFNMSDGIDGLCAGLSIFANAAFCYLFYLNGLDRCALFCLILIALLFVFLCFNFSSRWKIFLGDSGSASLGYLTFAILVTLTIKLKLVGVGTAIWFIACPLMGMGRVILLRLLKKRSPFQADRLHVHYLLLDAGMKKFVVLGFILICQLLFTATGFVFFYESVPALFSISLFVFIFFLFFSVMHPRAWQRWPFLKMELS